MLLSSHLLAEVEAVADRMMIIGGGRIQAQGTRAELLTESGTIVEADDLAGLDAALQRAGLATHPADGDRRLVEAEPEVVARAAMAGGVVLRRLARRRTPASNGSFFGNRPRLLLRARRGAGMGLGHAGLDPRDACSGWSSRSASRLYISYFGNYNETYGTLGAFIMLLTWFYLSGLAILVGAEVNAEIEHASPYGKDVGEKVPGEKKKIGTLAKRCYEDKKARGELDPEPFADDENCDLDRKVPRAAQPGVRPSDIIIGAAALLPAALKIGKEIREKTDRRVAA